MSGLPYEVETIIWVTDNTKRTIADDRRIIDKVLASFHKRIVAVTINTIVAIRIWSGRTSLQILSRRQDRQDIRSYTKDRECFILHIIHFQTPPLHSSLSCFFSQTRHIVLPQCSQKENLWRRYCWCHAQFLSPALTVTPPNLFFYFLFSSIFIEILNLFGLFYVFFKFFFNFFLFNRNSLSHPILDLFYPRIP